MSIGTQSQTDSVYLSSSISSLNRSKKSTSEISKTYKHASQLYLTRRLLECYEALQPVIRPPTAPEKETNGHVSASEDDSKPRAPIASASTSQRIKIWSLYVTLLNTIVELGDEEGKRDFGSKLYRDIVRNVQNGEVWEQVVRDGYMGREASVDAEVVYNLSNLLLGQAQDQITNQTRLETYLSTSPYDSNSSSISIDISSAFQNGNGASKAPQSSGMDTPKDLNSRIKILELFVLHVLPANNEWDYARSFVTNSDILDEERREAFLQTLNELQEAKAQEEAETAAAQEEDLVGFAEETEDEEQQERIHMDDGEEGLNGHDQRHHPPDRKPSHRRTSSEVDYGIDDDLLKARNPQPPSAATTKATITAPSTRTQSPPPSSTSPPTPQTSRKPPAVPPPARRPPTSKKTTPQPSSIAKLIRILSNLTSAIATSLTRNPTQVFRTLMFLVAFLAVLARRDVRERVKRVLESGWMKVRQTAGMGVRVSYV